MSAAGPKEGRRKALLNGGTVGATESKDRRPLNGGNPSPSC